MMDNLLDKLRSGETENRQRRERRQQRRLKQQRDGDQQPISPTETTDELKIDTTMISAEDLLKRLQTDSIAL